jgi:hypothetical protein
LNIGALFEQCLDAKVSVKDYGKWISQQMIDASTRVSNKSFT